MVATWSHLYGNAKCFSSSSDINYSILTYDSLKLYKEILCSVGWYKYGKQIPGPAGDVPVADEQGRSSQSADYGKRPPRGTSEQKGCQGEIFW